jgi:GNAT superfamily N-acetyltransferase
LRQPQIRRLDDGEWVRYREIRLRALADAPAAFSTSLAEAAGWPETEWRARVAGRTTFVADDEGSLVGLVSGIGTDHPDAAELISMWVQPDWRARDVGGRLVEALAGWAAGEAVSRLRLWVADGNGPAERLYRRHGFRRTGERQPLGTYGRAEFAMERRLG